MYVSINQILRVICILLLLSEYSLAQVPTASNAINSNGLAHGDWVVLFDRDWEPAYRVEDVSYYRKVSFNNGVPVGIVRDYYLNGTLQFEGKLSSCNPKDIPHGLCTWYHPNGKKAQECTFNNGSPICEIKKWDENGQLIQKKYKFVSALARNERTINSEFNIYAKPSRTVIQVDLPLNTEYYIVKISMRNINQGGEDNSVELIKLLASVVAPAYPLVSQSLGYIFSSIPTDACNTTICITDKKNAELFQQVKEYACWKSDNNIKTLTRAVNNFEPGKAYICIDNHNNRTAVIATVEVVAVVAE
ncbi:MAG: hypothetical protein KF690_00660 [Bacteroidetes bacterium]|nr:hypothetical protein [Bacteroidota bacterium]